MLKTPIDFTRTKDGEPPINGMFEVEMKAGAFRAACEAAARAGGFREPLPSRGAPVTIRGNDVTLHVHGPQREGLSTAVLITFEWPVAITAADRDDLDARVLAA